MKAVYAKDSKRWYVIFDHGTMRASSPSLVGAIWTMVRWKLGLIKPNR